MRSQSAAPRKNFFTNRPAAKKAKPIARERDRKGEKGELRQPPLRLLALGALDSFRDGVEGAVKERDDGEDATDDSAERRDKLIPPLAALDDNDGSGREVEGKLGLRDGRVGLVTMVGRGHLVAEGVLTVENARLADAVVGADDLDIVLVRDVLLGVDEDLAVERADISANVLREVAHNAARQWLAKREVVNNVRKIGGFRVEIVRV